MKKKTGQVLSFMLALMALLGVAALAADAGSQQDPLVTLSYLNDTYIPALLSRVDEKISQRDGALAQKLAEQIRQMEEDLAAKYGAGSSSAASGTAAVYTVVTLTKGQVLTGEVGCEVMLRIGKASCVSESTPGLVDMTAGTTINGGANLETNHMYMMTIEGRGVKALSDTVKVLVRGGYAIA